MTALPEFFNEMSNADGAPREPYRGYARWFDREDIKRLKKKAAEAEAFFRRTGITFNVYGQQEATERLIPFDIVPRIISASEWAKLERGIEQRVRAINAFLHDLVKPEHRARFVADFDALASERGLTEDEQDLIRNRRWIEMVRRGVSFFVLEKMAAVLGVSNPEVYAAFRGETLAQFLATRKVPMTYSVAGGDKVKAMDKG